MSRYLRHFTAFALVACLPWIAGCGVRESKLAESGATLTGTITYKDAPIEFAMVIVQGDNDVTTTGKVGDDGKYKVENVPLGTVKIAVNTQAGQSDFQTKSMQQNSAALDPKATKKPTLPKFVDVPQKYFDVKTSGLTTTIQKGENTFDIKCTD